MVFCVICLCCCFYLFSCGFLGGGDVVGRGVGEGLFLYLFLLLVLCWGFCGGVVFVFCCCCCCGFLFVMGMHASY